MSGDVLKTIKLGDVSDYGPISIKHKYNLDFLKSLVNKEKKNTHTVELSCNTFYLLSYRNIGA